jgi:hypothetical protein
VNLDTAGLRSGPGTGCFLSNFSGTVPYQRIELSVYLSLRICRTEEENHQPAVKWCDLVSLVFVIVMFINLLFN